jgi:hypothetical protein
MELISHNPCGKSKLHKKTLETADLAKLTKLISMCGMLLQSLPILEEKIRKRRK